MRMDFDGTWFPFDLYVQSVLGGTVEVEVE
jgi:hypothetical protein